MSDARLENGQLNAAFNDSGIDGVMGQNERAWELFTMLNPVNHGTSPENIATYKVEPYVVAADVYSVDPHIGRGGWTWYTGSAGWMYRLLVETLLGVNVEGANLRLTPRLPESWNTYKIHYRYRQTVCHITITRCDGSNQLILDGETLTTETVPLVDDRCEHVVELNICNDPICAKTGQRKKSQWSANVTF